METSDLFRALERYKAALTEEDPEESPRSLFRALWTQVGSLNAPQPLYECGSFRVDGTPDEMYRALYLFGPKSVDFSDMYKTRLFFALAQGGEFGISVELFKYEVGVYLCCTKPHLTGRGTSVVGGWPGADNGWRCSDPTGAALFEAVRDALSREWGVYPGNNFTV